ncbi:MAG: hypothetical protein AB7G44_02885 [Bacteroidia bacterium]
MNTQVDLSNSEYTPLTVISDSEAKSLGSIKGKGWSFTNIYHLIELRNVFLALKIHSFNGDIKNFTKYCIDKLPYEEKKWNYRKVEEYINALRNFGILGERNLIENDFFEDNSFDSPLSQKDINSLKTIYYGYFRFKEIHSWFLSINPLDRKDSIEKVDSKDLISKSNKLYSFSYNSRFTDAYITELKDNTKVFYLDNNNKMNRALMRLWDVYVKWGRTLGVLEKFSLDQVGISLEKKKLLNCTYHLKDDKPKFKLFDYIFLNFGKQKVFLPDLVFKIACEERLSIEAINNFIIEEYLHNREIFNIENTSEIFIKVRKLREKETMLYPLYRDSYISHINVIK